MAEVIITRERTETPVGGDGRAVGKVMINDDDDDDKEDHDDDDDGGDGQAAGKASENSFSETGILLDMALHMSHTRLFDLQCTPPKKLE